METEAPARRRAGCETDDVTVVVATRNRRERLRETLPRHAAPVILVDNGSDDGGPDDHPGVDVVRLGANRGAAARNAGVQRATTPFVAFADDDSWWEPGSLARAAALLRAYPATGLVSARVLVGPQQREDPICAALAEARFGVPDDAPGPAILGFLACAVMVRREAFLAAGGFHPMLHVYGEEALLAMDLAAAGQRLAYVPELTVRHMPLPAGRDNTARRRREVRNRVLTALLRRPPAVIRATCAAAWREDRGGVRDALALLPEVLRQRRTLPRDVERDLRLLD
ncbi:glycosyltransferase family 2 protein [Actinoplanes sp. N902-109]|uniref:glycosyltransferase family 2 protein n=1 Tax=Actinoplanes sp. (strain N902-109) TaxID=649831 RepID=UPI000686DD5D|nr:glycosyltransferase [Actinoplanes sp. N902-109]